MGALLREQLERRRAADPALAPDAPLFTFDGRRRVSPGTASGTFHHLVGTLELAIPEGVAPPRLHDLRHSFAVGCLLRWYREGLEPSARLHPLSTFMGHVDPASTAVYLTVTPALLEVAAPRPESGAPEDRPNRALRGPAPGRSEGGPSDMSENRPRAYNRPARADSGAHNT